MAAIRQPYPGTRRGIPSQLGLRVNWWILGSIVVLAVGAALPVLQNSGVTARGFDVQRIEARQAQLSSEIRLTEKDVAALTSLDRIERRARDLGLGPGDEPYFVSIDEAGPAPAKIPAEYLPGPAPKTGEADPWWRSLFSWMPLGK
jgi:hypothetical protein